MMTPHQMPKRWGTSRRQHRVRRAFGGCRRRQLHGPYGFHSQDEASPCLTIDLGRPHAISKVKVFARGDGPFDQSIPLALDFSDDGVSFRKVAGRTEPFSQADPWVVTVGLVARFVRLKAERHCALVVSEVEVYGRPR